MSKSAAPGFWSPGLLQHGITECGWMVAASPVGVRFAAAPARLRLSLRCSPSSAARGENEEGRDSVASALELQADENGLETISAQITPIIDNFFASDINGDPDRPMQGFSPMSEAIEAIGEGKYVIVVDEENVGHLIMAASLVTPECTAFIVKHGTGLVFCAMSGKELDRLRIPLVVPDQDESSLCVSVDAKSGTTTGVSAQDRANTILALASSDSRPEHFRRPGHIFPVRCHHGGVLCRPASAEAAVDLVSLSGLQSVAVSSHLVNQDKDLMTEVPEIKNFATKHGLPIISVLDLIRYMKKREKLVERTAVARLPTKWGDFKAYSYKSKLNGTEHIALVKGDIGDGQDVLVRVHSECLTGDILGSMRCPCGNSLDLAMQRIEKAGRGVLVYLRGHEGVRVGLAYKLGLYSILDEGEDDAMEENKVDSRDYGIGAQILRDIGVRTMKLMTNNPAKYLGLRGYGLAVTSRVPVPTP